MGKTLATIGLVAALAALEPIVVEAGGRMGGMGGGSWGGHSGGSWGGHSRGHSGHSYRSPTGSYRYYYRPYYYWPYYYSAFYWAPPGYAAGSGFSYSTPPEGYDLNAPSGSYSSPAAPQFQTEVVFPEGRYYLQGDGVAVPYRWVWVPNPPTAPPPSDTQEPR